MGFFLYFLMLNIYIFFIGLVFKFSGGWRMIIYLLYFLLQGINFFIDLSICLVKYIVFDIVVDMIVMLGFLVELGKVDIKNVFCLLLIYLGDFDLLGFKFKN